MVNFQHHLTQLSKSNFLSSFGPFLLLATLMLLLHVFPDLITTFEYNRNAIQSGQVWRIFTGHLLHTNNYHLALNLAALILLALIHNKFYSPKLLTTFYVTTSIAVSTGIYLFTPEMIYYVGLSGILHGLFVLGALYDIKHKEKTGYLLLIGIVAKVLHEQWFGATESLKQLIDADVAIDSHLYGMCTGIAFFFLHRGYEIYFAKNQKTS